MRKLCLLAASILVFGLSACTNEQLYDTLGSWRRSTCETPDANDRARCLAEADKSYNDYERDREDATKPK